MNNYLLSRRDARFEHHIPLQTARYTHATKLPFRNTGNGWMLNLRGRGWSGGKVSKTVFTDKY